jgi:hypothetical protein
MRTFPRQPQRFSISVFSVSLLRISASCFVDFRSFFSSFSSVPGGGSAEDAELAAVAPGDRGDVAFRSIRQRDEQPIRPRDSRADLAWVSCRRHPLVKAMGAVCRYEEKQKYGKQKVEISLGISAFRFQLFAMPVVARTCRGAHPGVITSICPA